mmetsp:Transcript_39693/g.92128  ORF Transcript_39693/g.92128 Transcript_39693/m.92128 type:complete len:238 (-) Transcript_39693:53-766(-)
MNWTARQAEVTGSSLWQGLKPGASCRLEPREPRRVLSDISNSSIVNSGGFGSGGGLGSLRGGCLDPQTPVRRPSAFTIFDDSLGDSCASKRAASPPRVPTKTQVASSPSLFSDNRLLSIEELAPSTMDGDFGALLESCDGFGSAADLASALLRSTGQECLEAHAHQVRRWSHAVDLPDDDFLHSPAADESMEVWPSLLTPQHEREAADFPLSPLPLLPPLAMDVSDDEGDLGESFTA